MVAHAKRQIVLKCIVNVFQQEKCVPLNAHVMGVTINKDMKSTFKWSKIN